jgi:outer membrane immunogenic protein
MRRLRISIVMTAASVIAAPALGADLAVKAPPPAVAPYYDWTGFYLGANAGYSVGRDPTTVTAISGVAVADHETFKLAPAGWLAGFQLGYNRQFEHVVLGVEADWQWTGQRDTACVLNCTFNFSLTEQQRLEWFGTARVRAGYALDHWLWYATGGIAWGRVRESQALQENVTFVIPPVSTAGMTTAATTNVGWVLGAGVETAIGGNWTAKLEYLHVDLGRTTNTFTVILPGLLGPPFPFTPTTSSEIRDNIIRAGLNYRFAPSTGTPAASPGGYYKAPPSASAAVHDWTGLYVGANAGYAIGRSPSSETDFGVAGIAPPLLANDSFKLSPDGGLIGAQAGFNWQSGHVVLGAEADWQWTHQSDTACVESCLLPTMQATTLSQTVDWFATARARAGYTFDQWLWYATGGFAVARVNNSIAFNDAVAAGSAASVQTRTGWVAGTGVETALWGSWSAKFEYLYMHLGNATESFTLPLGNGVVLNFTGRSDLRDNIFRAGLNYKFSGPVLPRS